jgi:hypothetical protein
MKNKTYSIFGAGASGLYTAWRLLWGEPAPGQDGANLPVSGDVIELYDWGHYDFSDQKEADSRVPGARVCTWHFNDDETNSYLELGGMRYSEWNVNVPDPNAANNPGQRVVTNVIQRLGLDRYSVPFNVSLNTLFCLRSKNIYLKDINSTNPAPYNVNNFGAAVSPDNGFGVIESLAIPQGQANTRMDWCKFYRDGEIIVELPESSVYQKGNKLKNIGYWDLMFDQLGAEGFAYTADGNGYTSNVINWNAAVAIQSNDEFAPGSQYKTLTKGYSYMFNALYDDIVKLAAKKGVTFKYVYNTRLHSILQKGAEVHFTVATRENPNKKAASGVCNFAWMAMPPYALDLVAQATRYTDHDGIDVLNHEKVQNYLSSAIQQPSYKIGMFFDSPWWIKDPGNTVSATYPAKILAWELTDSVLVALEKGGFPETYIEKMAKCPSILQTPFTSTQEIINNVQQCIGERLTIRQENALLAASQRNTIGPSVTDTPIRQVVYFGNNAIEKKEKPIYGILASYDDEQFTSFWEELEYGNNDAEKVPFSENYQPLNGPKKATGVMIKMLRQQLAALHFGPQADYSIVPAPLECKYMDWSLPPFNAGYHAYAAHYDVCDVQQKIRKPSQLIDGADANIFIVGEAFSNDQAWVEGAYCTAESVLKDFFGIAPIIHDTYYPFICPCC